MININQIQSTDLFSYASLELNLLDRGLVLVEGKNGSGKSTIFETLLWTLFGETSKKLKADDVIRENLDHSLAKGRTCGYVSLDCDGTVVEVYRYRKHKKYENSMLLFADRQPLKMGSDSETLKRLEKMIGHDFDTFCTTVVFPQGGTEFVGLNDAAIKSILDRVFHVERFGEAQERAKEQLKFLREQFLKSSSSQQEIGRQIVDADDDLKQLRTKQSDFNSQRKLDEAAKQDALNKLHANVPTVDRNLVAECEMLAVSTDAAKFVEVQNKISEINKRRTAELEQRAKAEAGLSILHQTLAKIELPETSPPPPPPGVTVAALEAEKRRQESQMNSDIAGLAVVENDLRRVSTAIEGYSGTCPMCQTPLPEEQQRTVISDLQGEQDRLIARRTEVNRLITDRRHLIWNIEQQITQYKQYADVCAYRGTELQIMELQKVIDRHYETIRSLDEELTTAEQHQNKLLDFRSNFDRLTQQLRDQQQAVSKWQQEVGRAADALNEATTRINPHNEQIAHVEDQQAARRKRLQLISWATSTCKDQITVKEFWEDGFGNNGAKSLFYSHQLPALNERTNEYLRILSGGRFSVRFKSQTTLGSGEVRDKFECEVLLAEGGSGYRKASGGERRRINLAGLFALGDLASDRPETAVRLRLLDEPFDDLDPEGCEQVVQALNQLVVPKSGTVLVMTHSDKLKSLIRNRITVKKTRGTSYIE
jgi:DNA repair exonuclease SbcCD ATPase subunit